MSNSVSVKDILAAVRPRIMGRGDKYLKEIGQELRRSLLKAQQRELPERYRLNEAHLNHAAACLVQFGEDLHDDIGLWRTVEQWQKNAFGTPLPFVMRPGEEESLVRFDVRRCQFFLWGLWKQLHPFTAIGIEDPAIVLMANTAARFLAERMERIPRDSGVKKLVSEPVRNFQELLTTLTWVSGGSYLFFSAFESEAREAKASSPDVFATSFVVRHFSVWSGLTPVEVFAELGNLTDDQRNEIRRWTGQSTDLFEVIERVDRGGVCESLQVINLITDEQCRVRVERSDYKVTKGMICYGRIVPWEGEYRWLGSFDFTPDPTAEVVENMKGMAARQKTFPVRSVVPGAAEAARSKLKELHTQFAVRHGEAWARFPDARSAVREVLGVLTGKQDDAINAMLDELAKRQDSFSKMLKEASGAVGLFFHPEQGPELMEHFDRVIRGMEKRGADLDDEDVKAIFLAIATVTASPEFVRALADKYGPQSIYATFLLPLESPGWALEYLFRLHKTLYWHVRDVMPLLPVATEFLADR